MRRAVVICEGQTEEAFIARVLAPALMAKDLYLQGITVGTSHGHKGGALSYGRLRPALRNALADAKVVAVTTLIDLYQLDTDFPGYAVAAGLSHLPTRLHTLESAFHADIATYSGCNPARFIPYIQPHEFEALLFSNIDALVSVEAGWAAAADSLSRVRATVATPEDINHGPMTKPAARLETLLRGPSYRKLRHGPIAAERIGLAAIESQCPHFAGWLARLRVL
jgi:hypothetical protein